jgi:hypothetical protein
VCICALRTECRCFLRDTRHLGPFPSQDKLRQTAFLVSIFHPCPLSNRATDDSMRVAIYFTYQTSFSQDKVHPRGVNLLLAIYYIRSSSTNRQNIRGHESLSAGVLRRQYLRFDSDLNFVYATLAPGSSLLDSCSGPDRIWLEEFSSLII